MLAIQTKCSWQLSFNNNKKKPFLHTPCICSLRFECLTWSDLVLCCRPDGESDGTQLNGEKEGESRKGELLADKLPNPHSEYRQTFA